MPTMLSLKQNSIGLKAPPPETNPLTAASPIST